MPTVGCSCSVKRVMARKCCGILLPPAAICCQTNRILSCCTRSLLHEMDSAAVHDKIKSMKRDGKLSRLRHVLRPCRWKVSLVGTPPSSGRKG